MEALAEQHVATYLTRGGKVFIAPQYSVPGDKPDNEWSCPDFVALSFEKPERPEVLVVEVASGSDSRRMIEIVQKRDAQWFGRLRAKLKADAVIDDHWPIRFIGFVRRANLDRLKRTFADASDVRFMAIEDATFSWDYWEQRKSGLP